MAALTLLLRDRELFERTVLLPVCVAGAVLVPVLIYLGVLR